MRSSSIYQTKKVLKENQVIESSGYKNLLDYKLTFTTKLKNKLSVIHSDSHLDKTYEVKPNNVTLVLEHKRYRQMSGSCVSNGRQGDNRKEWRLIGIEGQYDGGLANR